MTIMTTYGDSTGRFYQQLIATADHRDVGEIKRGSKGVGNMSTVSGQSLCDNFTPLQN